MATGVLETKKKHRPQRTCLGCGMRDDQAKLMRLTAPGPDQLRLEPHGGRGGYLHLDSNCHSAFVGRKGHYRAFHVEISRKMKAQFVDDIAVGAWSKTRWEKRESIY